MLLSWAAIAYLCCRRVGAGSVVPLATCSIRKKQIKRSTAILNLRKAAVDHQKFVKGTTMYPLEQSLGHGLLCTFSTDWNWAVWHWASWFIIKLLFHVHHMIATIREVGVWELSWKHRELTCTCWKFSCWITLYPLLALFCFTEFCFFIVKRQMLVKKSIFFHRFQV